MIDYLEMVEDNAACLLANDDPASVGRERIAQAVSAASATVQVMHGKCVRAEEVEYVVRKLETRFDICMSLGTMFSSQDYRPWLDSVQGDVAWYYWRRYQRMLRQERFPPQVVSSLHNITNQILDHLENPQKAGTWARKGMVVGYVQSGKTANYTGLVCKAADAGYRVIIILAGMLNALRNQTQERVDAGFLGVDSSRVLDNVPLEDKLIGVGLIDAGRRAVSFTTSKRDFNVDTARQIGMHLAALNEPLVLVIKKNVNTLRTLIQWLKHNNRHNLQEHPMLLVDDEADHASVNTNKEGADATAINARIRELLHLFDRSSYVGYTATPFANIFIDPVTDDEMLGDDLFPRDFIHSLDPPGNYVGPDAVFGENPKYHILRTVDDHAEFLPLRHKKDELPEELPDSLKEAIRTFVLVRAIRILRGHLDQHHSMMINVSRFTAVQSQVKLLVAEYVDHLRSAITNYSLLPEGEALENSELSALRATWTKEFAQASPPWAEIQPTLRDAVSPIRVIEVNSSAASEPLDYSEFDYPSGRSVIAVGGLSLSRGLTLEGLSVSYFLRNSVMYDTLMQMGRWFGYRDGYADLCRIYMTEEAVSWYSHIADVIQELRGEFARMKAAGMSPRDFGLCVRSHPESLIVTARNKMRTGKKVLRQVDLTGRLVETSVLPVDPEIVAANMRAIGDMAATAARNGKEGQLSVGSGFLWHNVHVAHVLDFLGAFQNHPASQLTEQGPLQDYVQWLRDSEGLSEWDVVLIGLSADASSAEGILIPGCSFRIRPQHRNVLVAGDTASARRIELNRRRVASRGAERAGLATEQVQEAEAEYPHSTNIPDRAYRGKRVAPLLMLHVLDCSEQSNPDVKLFPDGIGAYGISFPGTAGTRRPRKLAEYVVNTKWWQQQYLDLIEDDEGNEDA